MFLFLNFLPTLTVLLHPLDRVLSQVCMDADSLEDAASVYS